MLKKFSKAILAFTLSLTLIVGLVDQGAIAWAASRDDIATIKGRLKEYFLNLDTIDDGAKVEACYVSKAEDYLKLMKDDGSFDDVDYKATNNAANGAAWSPYLALDRLQAIAIAYNKPGNPLYQSEDAKSGIDKALKHWVTQGSRPNKPGGPYSTNWWENEVGVQLRFARIGLFMEGAISTEAYQVILDKLLEPGYKLNKRGTGQNNLWFAQSYVYHALLTNDEEKLKEMVTEYLDYCLSTQLDDNTAEAVQVDNSFYMHGRQFYSNGYGMSMFRDMSFWIYMLRDTKFAISQEVMDRMGDYMLKGTSWTIRGDIMELYLGYRPYKMDVGYKNYAEEYIEPLKRMIVADPVRSSEYKKVLDNIEGTTVSNGKNGNYYMWRSGYASHMRDDYGVNIKMDSKDLIGGEWRGNWNAGKNGNLIYWTSSAASTVTVDGDEYTSVYPTFDWAHSPGTTTPNRIEKDGSNYGRFTNGTSHMIGVSNGKYGSNAYVMSKKNTEATKGYFFFDNEFVALGAGISSKEGTPIHTTLNQSKAKNVTVDGQVVSTGTKAKSYTGRWIHNDKIGYVFPEETTFKVSNRTQKENPSLWGYAEKEATPETFTAWVDHGVKPSDESYEYIVLPNKISSEVEDYSNNIPIEIVSNTKDIQAVRHDGLKQTQINFYKAGSLEYKPGYTITVDQGCSIIIDESGSTRKITVAVNDNEAHKIVNINLSYGDEKTTTTFVSKALPYAGQSITLSEGQNDSYLASSSTEGHQAKNVGDGDESTYWQSQGNDYEWISVFAGADKYIKDVSILWGDNFAKEYDVYASKDGVNYDKIISITNGKGKLEKLPIGEVYSYIKIGMKSSSNNNYQIKEITMNQGEVLSLNKPTTTSSVSTQAPTFMGSRAVDGDTSTRWASARGSDDEWIIIDLEKNAQIDAIEINWESGCSDDYTIEVSPDNKNWTVLKQTKTDVSLKDEFNFGEPYYGRYVKIHSKKTRTVNNINYGISIFEVKVYGTYTDDQEPEEINIALNKPSKASSERENPVTGFVLESKYAFDGSIENRGDAFQSRWVSATRKDNPGVDVDSQYIQVDLEEVYEVSKVVLNWEGACGKEYKIQVSDDGENWTDMTHVTDGKAGIIEFAYDNPMAGRYVRMQGIEPTGQYGYSLWEFEVYGTKLKDKLKKYYDENKDIDVSRYTPRSVAEYVEALEKVLAVYNDKDATSTQILEAKVHLEKAINELTLKAEKVDLESEIKKAEAIDRNLYTNETVKVFDDALNEAKKVNKDENAIQDQVNKVIEELEKAIQALEKKDEIITTPEEPSDNSSDPVKTSDKTQGKAYFILIGASLCLMAYIALKKNKTSKISQ